jgi:hypothetical protein
MRKWFMLLTLLVVSLMPVGAQAQANARFSAVTVDVWPEYDQPSVLVIYHYSLAEDVTLPASLDLRIPAQANINAVAVLDDASGALITTNYQSKVSGDWATLSITADSRNIQVEYYDSYNKQGDTRSYAFIWPGNYAVDAFSVSFQKPVDSTDLKLNPDLGAGAVAEDGLTYYNSVVGALQVNQKYTLTVEYTKATDTLSKTAQIIKPSAPLDTNVQGRVSFSEYLPWILAGLGGLLVVGGLVFWFVNWRQTRKRTSRDSRKRHAVSASEKGDLPGNIYCHQCGKRAQPGDVFCRTCGSRMRRDGQP